MRRQPPRAESVGRCRDHDGVVHDLVGMFDTRCEWRRNWAQDEWPVVDKDEVITCLECIAMYAL